jgi:Zn-dependent peptidase ImmA (M78 family)
LEKGLRARIVWLVINGNAEKALNLLAEHYGVSTPKIAVGLPKGRKSRVLGCYNGRNRTIFVLNSDTLKEPFVILHEFYHHLRTSPEAKHRGTEKHANAFAQEFLQAYRTSMPEASGKN